MNVLLKVLLLGKHFQVTIMYYYFRCSYNGSKYCDDTPSNSTPPIIGKQLLLDEFTKSDEGWQLWHNIVAAVGILIVARIIAYIFLRVLNKPKTV